MNNRITVKPNQSILDVIIQSCGALESGMQMMLANSRSISDIPHVGDVVIINDGQLADEDNLLYLRQNDIVIGTLGTLPDIMLEFRIILYPKMKARPKTITTPDILGYYDYEFVAAGGFTNVYALLDTLYPSHPNTFYCQTTDDFLAGGPAGTIDNYIATVIMPPEEVEYRPLWTAGHDNMMIWTDLSVSPSGMTFEDINGNEAMVAPVLVLDKITQTIKETLNPLIAIELVSSHSGLATLRLTASHAAPATTDWTVNGMFWIDEAASGSPDPLDPLNPNKTIVVLGAGLHLLGVIGQYSPDGVTIWPARSVAEVVIEIS